MSINCLKIIVLSAIFCGLRLSADDIALSSNSQTSYRIAVSGEPTPAEITAAGELAKFLKSVTGAEFKTVKESEIPADGKAIYLGQTQYAAKHGVDYGKLGREDWVIRTTPDGNLILSGGRPRGTLYAVYEFLEKSIGCRWLDETNEIIPRVASLSIPEIKAQGHPYFRNRQIFDLLDWYPVSQAFKVRNKGTCYVGAEYGWAFKIGRPHQHHTFFSYSQTWPKDKMELYGLNKDGKRLVAVNGEGPGQICTSNPEVRKRVLAQLKEFIAQDRKDAAVPGAPPYPTIYDISQNDNEDYCRCEKCKVLAEKEGSQSGPILDFINEIAAGIKKDYPDVFIRTFAYTYSAKPPKNIKAADNVLIHIALLGLEFGHNKGPRDTMKILNHPDNKKSLALIEEWGKKASNIAMWDYWILYPPEPEPYVNIDAIPVNMALYKAMNVKDVFAEFEGVLCSNFFGLKRYLGYKLMQDPDQPSQPIINEFMKGYYGKAAPKMNELLAYMEKRQKEHKGPIGKVDVTMRPYLDIDYFKTTLTLLDEAEKAVADTPKQLANVRRERVPILAGLFMRWHHLGNAEKYFNGKDLLKQYEDISLAAIDHYFPAPDTQTFRQESLTNREKSLKRFRNNIVPIPLPVQFKNRKIVDLPWACFRTDIGHSTLIDDPEAVGGKAIALGKDVKDRTKSGQTDFGIYNWNENKVVCASAIKNTDIPKDEKYHLTKIAKADFVNDSQAYFYGGANWEMRCDLYRMFAPGSSYDLYVSVKFQGPDYVPGSTKDNSIMVERIVLVPNK